MKHKHVMLSHMNQQELAEYWGISTRTLERWRSIGWGPKFIKIGGRVVYRVEDILEYEIEHLYESTNSRVHPALPRKYADTAPSGPVLPTSLPEPPESEWKTINAEVRNGLLSIRVPPRFQCTGELEYCLVNGELYLRPKKLPVGLALRFANNSRY